jgi:hypothetical protein
MTSAKKRRFTKKPLWLRDLLNVDSIVEEAISELIKEMNVKNFLEILISRNLYEVLKKLEKKAHEIYKHYEDKVREKFMKGYYGKNIDANEFEKSLTNTRRRRAGETFEKIFLKILSEYKVPYEDHVNMCGAEFDIVIPNKEVALRNPRSVILISLKREVRERWKETVGDVYILKHRRNCEYSEIENIWFASLGKPSKKAVKVMTDLNIVVYVPDDVYEEMLNKVRSSFVKPLSKIIDDILERVGKSRTTSVTATQQHRYKTLDDYIKVSQK